MLRTLQMLHSTAVKQSDVKLAKLLYMHAHLHVVRPPTKQILPMLHSIVSSLVWHDVVTYTKPNLQRMQMYGCAGKVQIEFCCGCSSAVHLSMTAMVSSLLLYLPCVVDTEESSTSIYSGKPLPSNSKLELQHIIIARKPGMLSTDDLLAGQQALRLQREPCTRL